MSTWKGKGCSLRAASRAVECALTNEKSPSALSSIQRVESCYTINEHHVSRWGGACLTPCGRAAVAPPPGAPRKLRPSLFDGADGRECLMGMMMMIIMRRMGGGGHGLVACHQ